MNESITSKDVLAIFAKMANDLEAQKDYLCELDSIGDGDQGVTMAIGFQAVRDSLPGLAGSDIGTIVSKAGMTFNGKAASTIGALFQTACMRAGREMRGKNEIGLPDLVRMFEAAIAGVKERGKANVGDKTILDMLVPTAESLRKSWEGGANLEQALTASLEAAEAGVKATIPMRSAIGRASWLADRTVGHQDPGATSFYLMWKSTVEWMQAQG
jgi:phosphoenolpyruvate---glycerone phosphotransferase subunit DhaL